MTSTCVNAQYNNNISYNKSYYVIIKETNPNYLNSMCRDMDQYIKPSTIILKSIISNGIIFI